MSKNNGIETNIYGIVENIHENPEKEIKPEFHGTAERKTKKVTIETEVPDQIPTPVYLYLPWDQTSRARK